MNIHSPSIYWQSLQLSFKNRTSSFGLPSGVAPVDYFENLANLCLTIPRKALGYDVAIINSGFENRLGSSLITRIAAVALAILYYEFILPLSFIGLICTQLSTSYNHRLAIYNLQVSVNLYSDTQAIFNHAIASLEPKKFSQILATLSVERLPTSITAVLVQSLKHRSSYQIALAEQLKNKPLLQPMLLLQCDFDQFKTYVAVLHDGKDELFIQNTAALIMEFYGDKRNTKELDLEYCKKLCYIDQILGLDHNAEIRLEKMVFGPASPFDLSAKNPKYLKIHETFITSIRPRLNRYK
jgi:hypothetical protein